MLPSQGVGGRTLPKVFCKDVWSEPGNLYHISDQRLRVFILLFRPEPKINTPFQISKISTRLLYVSAVNWNWVAFAWTFERGYKFTDVDAEKNSFLPGKQNTQCQARGKSIFFFRPKWWNSMRFFRPGKQNTQSCLSQREKHTLYQTKMVKIYALFQTTIAKKHLPFGCHTYRNQGVLLVHP